MSQILTFVISIMAVAGGTAILSHGDVLLPGQKMMQTVRAGVNGGQRAVIHNRSAKTFQMPATINAVPIIFVVDTGASISVLTRADADRAGIRSSGVRQITGVGGSVLVERVVVDIEIGGQLITGTEAVISKDAPVSLLGMDILHALGTPQLIIR